MALGARKRQIPGGPQTGFRSSLDEIDPLWGTANVALLFLRLATVASSIQQRGIKTKSRPSGEPAPARRAIATLPSHEAGLIQRWHARRPRLPLTLQYFRECSTVKAYLITAVVVLVITVVAPLFLMLVRNF